MNRLRGRDCAVILAGLALAIMTMPAAWAQTARGANAVDCRNAPYSAAIAAACGQKPYERWQDGSPAMARGATGNTAPADRSPPYFLGGYSRFYGFGR